MRDSTTQRVQVPAHTDSWMMGDMYGNIVKITKCPRESMGTYFGRPVSNKGREIAHVLMDRSNKVKRFWLDECQTL